MWLDADDRELIGARLQGKVLGKDGPGEELAIGYQAGDFTTFSGGDVEHLDNYIFIVSIGLEQFGNPKGW